MIERLNNKTSIIIPCKNEGIYIKQTLEFLLQTEAEYLANIVIVDDNSNDGCCDFIKNQPNKFSKVMLIKTDGIGAARARNLGARLLPDTNILVFCDAHITMKYNWLNSLLNTFYNEEVSAVCPGISKFNPNSPIGYGQTINEKLQVTWLKKTEAITEVPLAPGGCMAVRKSIFDAAGGFDAGFHSWGYEDVEFSIKLWLFGYKIFVNPGVRIGHKFRKVQPYEVDETEYHYNRLRMAVSHFNQSRVNKVTNIMKNYPNYKNIMRRLINSNALQQRQNYFKCRVHDDSWFFHKFNIPF